MIDCNLRETQHNKGIPSKQEIDLCKTIQDLLVKWRAVHSDEIDANYISGNVPQAAFLPDGIVDSLQYQNAEKKILFIAKEANWFSSKDTDKERRQNVENDMFWHREAAFGRVPETIFSRRISMLTNAMFTNDYDTVNNTHTILQFVAVMNLNKRGGFSSCVWNTLENYVCRYKDFISREIKLIKPTIIVCCGSGVKWLLDKYISIPENIKVLKLSHPSYFALTNTEYLRQLECAIKGEIWRINKAKGTTNAKMHSESKGIIFDTNKSNSQSATFDMLTSGKISAYGSAVRFVNSFSVGDYAFYYVKGVGIIAAGEVLSELSEVAEFEGDNEVYKMIRMLVPDKIPSSEDGLRAISPAKLKELVKHGFYFASTVKKPYLSNEESECLIKELKKIYKKS